MAVFSFYKVGVSAMLLLVASAAEVANDSKSDAAENAISDAEDHFTRRLWARFSGDDCVKQVRANQAQCIPCKKNLTDGRQVDRFVGNCKRDATVLASQIFTPWHFCHADGSCPQGRLPKFRGRVCWAFNRGEFTRFDGPAGVCIKESWRSRHIPTVRYALANMAHGVNGGRNVADFVAAYQWSMEQRSLYGDQPHTVMTCQLFCKGLRACGEVGDCACGDECGPAVTALASSTLELNTTVSEVELGSETSAAATRLSLIAMMSMWFCCIRFFDLS